MEVKYREYKATAEQRGTERSDENAPHQALARRHQANIFISLRLCSQSF